MSSIFVAGHASGKPSPGGFGVLIKLGTVILLEHEQALNSTTTLNATLTGVREALQDLPDGTVYTEIHLNHFLACELLTNTLAPHHPQLAQLLCEIRTVQEYRRIETEYVHLLPGTHRDLDAADRMARKSAARAWTTIGSPACPNCGDQMITRHQATGTYWVCQSPHCGGRLRQYERRI